MRFFAGSGEFLTNRPGEEPLLFEVAGGDGELLIRYLQTDFSVDLISRSNFDRQLLFHGLATVLL